MKYDEIMYCLDMHRKLKEKPCYISDEIWGIATKVDTIIKHYIKDNELDNQFKE